MHSAVSEPNTQPDKGFAQGGRHEDFTVRCNGHHPGGCVHCKTAHFLAAHLALADVQPSSRLEAEFQHSATHRPRAPERSRGPIERREEAISCGVDLTAAEAGQLAADRRAVPPQYIPPTVVTDVSSHPGRTNDVGEE